MVYIIKVCRNGEVDRLKVWLDAKRYNQVYSLDCSDIFSMSNMTIIHFFFSKATICHWSLH